MKIAFIGQKGIPTQQGGIERHVEELATRLVLRGCEVVAYTRPQYVDKNLKEYKGVQLISLPTIHTKHLDALAHTLFACFNVGRHKVDVIHFHSIGPSLLIWLAKLLNPRTPVVATFHLQCYRHKKWGKFAQFSLRLGEALCCLGSDDLIVVSRNLKKMVLKKYKRIASYIPNGVPDYKRVEAKEIKKWGLQKESYLLYVGRLVESKGVHYLIEAFNRLKTDKKLVIVGDEQHSDGYEKRLKEMAKGNSNIIFTGNLAGNSRSLAELFSNAYFFVHPSEIEGLSISLLETMSYARAALVSDIPENMEAIQTAGFLFKNTDVDDLTAQLEKLLANPIEVAKKGIEAKKRVDESYSWEAVSDDILNLYKELKLEISKEKTQFPRIKYAKRLFGEIF